MTAPQLSGKHFPRKKAQSDQPTFDDIIGGNSIREKMQPVIGYLANYGDATHNKSGNLLVQGPPGTGKSLYLECLIAETDANSVIFEPEDWMQISYQDNNIIQQKLDAIVEQVSQKAPCILSMPDIGKVETENAEYLISQASRSPGVVVYAMNNPLETIAQTTQSLFDHTVESELPNEQERHVYLDKIKEAYSNNDMPYPFNFKTPFGVVMQTDTAELAHGSKNMSFRDIATTISATARGVLR